MRSFPGRAQAQHNQARALGRKTATAWASILLIRALFLISATAVVCAGRLLRPPPAFCNGRFLSRPPAFCNGRRLRCLSLSVTAANAAAAPIGQRPPPTARQLQL